MTINRKVNRAKDGQFYYKYELLVKECFDNFMPLLGIKLMVAIALHKLFSKKIN